MGLLTVATFCRATKRGLSRAQVGRNPVGTLVNAARRRPSHIAPRLRARACASAPSRRRGFASRINRNRAITDAITPPALWQHGFELPPHPFKVTAQLGDNGTVREVRTVHVVGYEGYSKPSPSGVLGTNEKPKTEGANCEWRHPGGNVIAAQATDEPSGYRSHKPHATDKNRIVSHSALRSIFNTAA
jgi:hypothetical protein